MSPLFGRPDEPIYKANPMHTVGGMFKRILVLATGVGKALLADLQPAAVVEDDLEQGARQHEAQAVQRVGARSAREQGPEQRRGACLASCCLP